MADPIYIIGVDGGGTKCRATLFSTKDGVISSGLSGPANPVRGVDASVTSIIDSCQQAIDNAKIQSLSLADVHVGLGLAGVNLESVRKKVLDWNHPFKSRYLTTDLHIACLGANNAQEGAVVIAGTGSCGLAIVEDKFTLVGGHGFPIGDYAGGAWIGFEAVRYVLKSLDGIEKPSKLNQALLAATNSANALELAEKMLQALPAEFAKLCPIVFDLAETGDHAAKHIITIGAEQISALCNRLLAENPTRLSMIGGVSMRIKPWLSQALQAKISVPFHQPDFGAILFTKQALNIN